METKQKHTPIPWTIGYGGGPDDEFASITSPHQASAICYIDPYMYRPHGPANADFIVRACNNHDALLAALKDTVCRLTELRDCTAMLGAAAVDRALIQIGIDQARAAIAQTEKD